MLSSPGVGSGLDIKGIVSQLMAIERQPLFRLGVQEVELKTKLSAFGQLSSTMSTFQSAMAELGDAEKFKVFAASSSDKAVLTATAASTAATGTFNIQVNRIAENHRMASNTTFTDTGTTLIGTAGDTMTITVGATAFVVDIGGKTLGDIRNAINGASDNAGVTASVLQDDTGHRLTLSANNTGSVNALAVAYSAADPFALQTLNADRDAIPGFASADLDAVITLEGLYTATRSSNTVSDVIDGVTLNLVAAGTAAVAVTRDTASVTGSVRSFVNAFNEVASLIARLRADILREDSASLRNLDAQFRNVLNTPADTGSVFSSLFEIGISTKKDGTLSLDSTVLNGALTTDFDGVAKLFADPTNGVAARLEDLARGFLEAGGILDGREQSLDRQIRDLQNRKANLEFRLQLKETRLLDQFTALDGLVAQLQGTGSFLTAQLDQIALISKSLNT